MGGWDARLLVFETVASPLEAPFSLGNVNLMLGKSHAASTAILASAFRSMVTWPLMENSGPRVITLNPEGSVNTLNGAETRNEDAPGDGKARKT